MATMKKVIAETCYTGDGREEQLFRAVISQTGAGWNEIYSRPEDFRNANYGVSGFTYYSDTEKFAKRNIDSILFCLANFEEEIGEPLKKDSSNYLNWLAWFALEHIIDKVMYYKEDKGE